MKDISISWNTGKEIKKVHSRGKNKTNKQFKYPSQALEAVYRISFLPYFPIHHHGYYFATEKERELKYFILLPKSLSTRNVFLPRKWPCACWCEPLQKDRQYLWAVWRLPSEYPSGKRGYASLHSLSLLGQLSNPKIASNFLWGIVLHKHKFNASKASKSWFS